MINWIKNLFKKKTKNVEQDYFLRHRFDEGSPVIDTLPKLYTGEAYKVPHTKLVTIPKRKNLVKAVRPKYSSSVNITNSQAVEPEPSIRYEKRAVTKSLPPITKNRRGVVEDDNFLTSMAVGYATDSTVAGAIIGGDPLGALLGDMLNSDDSTSSTEEKQFDGFEGGHFGGGGASGEWSEPEVQDDTRYQSDDSSSDYSNDSYDSSDSDSSSDY